jgi:hypothetical protein
MHPGGDVRVIPEDPTSAAPSPGDELARLQRRLDRERRARLAAEAEAERATLQLYDAVVEATNAEARARIVGDTAAAIFGGRLAVDDTLQAIAASARRALEARRATCYVCTEDESTISAVHTTEEDVAARAYVESALGRSTGVLPLWGLLAGDGDPLLVVEDLTAAPVDHAPLADALGASALVGLRLEHDSVRRVDGTATLGVLVVAFDEARPFSDAERMAARSLAALASMALANARLHESTLGSLAAAEERAATDHLTGLANHRTFQERLAEEVGRARRHSRPLSLAMLDIDHFKRVNDEHGPMWATACWSRWPSTWRASPARGTSWPGWAARSSPG